MNNEIVNDLFAGFVFYCCFLALVFAVIEAVFDDEPDTLGCPDPELHDRNNEARHGDVISTALNADSVGG